ncbi:hypothetical protein C9374_000775 [Naegleria lovaniensis]|uniref:RGS domain-containing protein n=1 Tax=Naegleria lovaniensis TaxID=51637 RepID=A0AA88KLI0_NAELO|nr:uncharacterized protein C9374_000775 [Naegleria lovaniensis]KAG2387925.1 hypothetical protein C9374_000775 [Naegleria lovaniensis]
MPASSYQQEPTSTSAESNHIQYSTLDVFMNRFSQASPQQFTILSSNSSLIAITLNYTRLFAQRDESRSRLKLFETSNLQDISSLNHSVIHIYVEDTNEKFIGADKDHMKSVISHAFNVLSIHPSRVIFARRWYFDCMAGNPFLDTPQQALVKYLITTDYELPKVIRRVRESYLLAHDRWLELSDFTMLPLFPYELQYQISNQGNDNVSSLHKEEETLGVLLNIQLTNCLQSMTWCAQFDGTNRTSSKCYRSHDYCWLRLMSQEPSQYGRSMFSLHPQFMKALNDHWVRLNFSSKTSSVLKFNDTIASSVFTQFEQLNQQAFRRLWISKFDQQDSSLNWYALNTSTELLHSSLTNIKTDIFLPSIIFECKSSVCLLEPPTADIFFLIPAAIFCVLHFVGLAFFFNRRSIKVRLLFPYWGPLACLTAFIGHTDFVVSACATLGHTILVVVAWSTIAVYCVTLLRYLFLRNIYSILSLTDQPAQAGKRNKEHENKGSFLCLNCVHGGFLQRLFTVERVKKLASKRVGIFTSLVLALLVALCMWALIPFFVTFYLTSSANLLRNILLACFVVMGICVALLYIGVDMYLNRDKIRKQGVLHFLLHDDPFYIHVDMILLFIMIVALIFVIVFDIIAISLIGKVLWMLLPFLAAGGMIMIFEIIVLVKSKFFKSVKQAQYESDLERMIYGDNNLFQHLKSYAEKELSLENILFLQKMMDLSALNRPIMKNSHLASSGSSLGVSRESLSSNTTSNSGQSPLVIERGSDVSNSAALMVTLMPWEEVTTIEEEFLRPYSKYELNIPSSTRKGFYEWFNNEKKKFLEDSSHHRVSLDEVKELLMQDVMMNVKDTFLRFQNTPEYAKWESLMELQKSNAVI